MKLQDQVCTIEQARRLLESGVAQQGYYCYAHRVVNSIPCFNGEIAEWESEYSDDTELIETGLAQFDGLPHVGAFTVAELGVMLPAGYDTMYCTNNGWRGFDLESSDMLDSKVFSTEAECRAAMLIHLIETNAITIDEVNARLCADK